jgi:hypothetical protein
MLVLLIIAALDDCCFTLVIGTIRKVEKEPVESNTWDQLSSGR